MNTIAFEDINIEASDQDIELSSIEDISNDLLSKEELNYYLNLEDL